MRILGIETSCDETSAAVVEDGTQVLSNVISSQVELHARYGGIVPEVASRQHVLQILPLIREALSRAKVSWSDIDAIAVTCGPGLAGALLVGINTAKAIAMGKCLPLVGVNHLEAHIYSNWLAAAAQDAEPPQFPLLCLIASGGHTDLVLMRAHGDYQMLGRTRDDAAGEAFDKVARILGLAYPGGPPIQKTAETATEPFSLPRAWLKGSDDFSFSGLKTAALHLAQEQGIYPANGGDPTQRERVVANIAAGFQEAVVDVLAAKTTAAAKRLGVRQVLLAGGVAANKPLRQRLVECSPVSVLIPPPVLCTDNAAMIAACGYFQLQRGHRSGLDLDVQPNMLLS
ncbi:MAG: tRNA (adenosine(37)-N6)-threonylcarbamoyltransferase complex transferase subunit TsaD [Chloroflexi bacterium]|nr:tRNA (adenosine(37)-N6)-threonylcarbamoyltransferase complex transferase subunit TsaD [Chloroflexota bacterium]